MIVASLLSCSLFACIRSHCGAGAACCQKGGPGKEGCGARQCVVDCVTVGGDRQAVADNIKPFHFVDTGEGFVVDTVEILPGYSKYAACAACHGANGGGGVGPALVGQTADYLTGRLNAYRAGEKVGSQSNLMWAQAGALSDQDISDLVEYVGTL